MPTQSGAVKYRGRILAPGLKKPDRTPKLGSVYRSFEEGKQFLGPSLVFLLAFLFFVCFIVDFRLA